MLIKKVNFIKSTTNINDCPKPQYPEIALIGRSNVGKSSLINMICNHHKLAKVSETPGKTKTINHFLINENWYLVDLPGYGYAKASKTEKEKFQQMIETYLSQRKTLKCTMVLLDSRLPFQNNDKKFIEWLVKKQLPFAVILTKTDKLSATQLKKQLNYFETIFFDWFEEAPNIFLTSSQTKYGRKDLLDFFDYLINPQNQ